MCVCVLVPLKCAAVLNTTWSVSAVLRGPRRRTGLVAGWPAGGGLTELTAPVMLSYCVIAFDGLAGQDGVHGGLEGIGSMPWVWFQFSTCSG